MKSVSVVVCQTGVGKHAPTLRADVVGTNCVLETVECFDRCETCEKWLLARVDGAMMRFHSPAELMEAVVALGEAE